MSLFADISAGRIEAVKAELNRLQRLGSDGEAELFQKLREINGSGKSILHAAAETGRIDMVRLLLDWDVVIDHVDNNQRKASDLAHHFAKTDVTADAQARQRFAEVAALLRTREAWQENSAGFRFNRVINLIEHAIPAVEEGNNKDKVLLIGRTGAGKSSFLNYANGTRYQLAMEPEAGRGFLQVTGGNPEIAEVGTTVISQTLYPQVVTIPNQSFVFCDLAGLFDQRGNEARIVAASSTQILTRLPGKIKAIAVVLDLPSFLPKGEAFKETLQALSKILGNKKELFNSLHFVITKAPETVTITGICNAFIKPILSALNKDAATRPLTDEEMRLVDILTYMDQNRDRILIPKVCDQGQSYAAIRDALSHVIAKDANLFDFTRHDNSQEEFNSVLSKIGSEYTARKIKIEQTIPQALVDEAAKQATEVANITRWEAEIAERRHEMSQPYDASALDASVNQKNQEIATNTTQIQAQNTILSTENTNLGRIRGELGVLDTDANVGITSPEPFGYKGLSYRDKFLFWDVGPERPVPGDSEHDFSFNASYPLSDVTFQKNCGSFSSFHWQRDSKTLTAVYKYPRGQDAKATIQLYAKSKDINADRIRTLKQEATDTQTRINAANAEITRLQARNDVLHNEIRAIEVERIQGRANVEIRNQRLGLEIETRLAWINGRAAQEARPATANTPAQEARPAIIGAVQKRDEAIANQIRLNAERTNLELELHVNQDLFRTVVKVTRILQLDLPDLQRLMTDFPATRATNTNTAPTNGFFRAGNNNQTPVTTTTMTTNFTA